MPKSNLPILHNRSILRIEEIYLMELGLARGLGRVLTKFLRARVVIYHWSRRGWYRSRFFYNGRVGIFCSNRLGIDENTFFFVTIGRDFGIFWYNRTDMVFSSFVVR